MMTRLSPDIKLCFTAGTVEIRGFGKEPPFPFPDGVLWDHRTRCHRAPALAYAAIVESLGLHGVSFTDDARRFDDLKTSLKVKRVPRPFQQEAFEAWYDSGGRGLVVLPTGAGKSYVGLMAIDAVRKSTLVVAPTLNLVTQWYDLLRTSFRCDVGVVGGGEFTIEPLTATTYDSAYLHMEHLGARFGMIIFDECHHLPGDSFSLAASSCLAPYRLGLSATPERADGKHVDFSHLIGPTAYACEIGDLAGEYLADYTIERLLVELSEEERSEYEKARGIYLAFIARHGIRMHTPDGWKQFLKRSGSGIEGRRAMEAYQKQKHLAFSAPSKLKYIDHLLHRHRHDRVLLFTERNKPAYELSRRFLVPVITHQTRVTERAEILDGFSKGTYNVLAASKVLNEGVDIPEANVGIIISGSGSIREHVQRLGRILRKKGEKQAVLYEIVANDTSEMFTSRRRRAHVAYR